MKSRKLGIDRVLPGLDRALGRVREGRDRDRFRLSADTRNPHTKNERDLMVRSLAARASMVPELWQLLGLALDGKVGIGELHDAFRRDPLHLTGVQPLLAERKGDLLWPLVERYVAQKGTAESEGDRTKLARFVAFLGGPERAKAHDFTTQAAREFVTNLAPARRDAPLSNATRNRYRAVLQDFGGWLFTEGKLASHPIPFRALRRYREAPRVVEMSSDQRQTYLKGVVDVDPELVPVFMVLMYAGADVSEVIPTARGDWEALRVRDCYLERKVPQLRFKRHKVEHSPVRMVPIPRAVARAIQDHIERYGLESNDLLFAGITDERAWRVHKIVRERMSWPQLRRKDLRHVAAIRWRRLGYDVQTIRDWLGHLSITQTMIYAAFTPDDEHGALAVEDDVLRAVEAA